MKNDFDINEVVSNFLTEKLDSLIEIGKGSGKVIFRAASDNIRLNLVGTYRDYLTRVLKKYSKSKSFFIREQPVQLYNFYVPLSVSNGKQIIANPTLEDIYNFSRCSIVFGTGGSGKSMFMKHLLINSIMNGKRVPVFIELRQVNQNGYSLKELIAITLKSNKFNLDETFIDKAMNKGHFVFFFDGFDEVIHSKRKSVLMDIQDLSKKYDLNQFVISSRPDNQLESISDFSILHIAPLNLNQAQDLILLLDYDNDLKTRFLDELEDKLFKTHKSFVSNPLLLSIMLITYSLSANIPNKLSIFYNQAYEALYERHDTMKPAFHRQRRTSLDIHDFSKIFSTFCIQTYDQNIYEMSHIEALKYIDDALQISGIDCNRNDYLKDAIQAVCLLVEEGLMIVFSHRSFQEYFTACFIADANDEIQDALIQKYSPRIGVDHVLHLLYEMRPELIESKYIIPGLNTLFKSIDAKETIEMTNYIKYVKKYLPSFRFHKDGCVVEYPPKPEIIYMIEFVIDKCGHLVKYKSKFDIKYYNYLREKYASDINTEIVTNKLTIRDTFFKDLSQSGDIFSINALLALNNIRKILINKTELSTKSLKKILQVEKTSKKITRKTTAVQNTE